MTASLGLDGVNASLALPMDERGEPDIPAMRRYVAWILEQGVSALTVNADTGEGAHLSLGERLRVVSAVKEDAGAVPVISGLIASHTAQAVELASALQSAGADGLLVFAIPAFQGTPLPAELVYRYFASVGEVGLPLIVFNLTPSLGGVVFEPQCLRRVFDVPQCTALKEASFDPLAYVHGRDAVRGLPRDDVALLSGCDNLIYESFVLGAGGALLGYAGLAGALTVRLLELVKAHRYDEAERLNRDRVQPLAEAMFAAPARNSRARIKYGLKLLGVIDDDAVRAPLLPLEEWERSAMKSSMGQAGLL
jgi:4-hydroxy-tetrahydrodipicolinate synthase